MMFAMASFVFAVVFSVSFAQENSVFMPDSQQFVDEPSAFAQETTAIVQEPQPVVQEAPLPPPHKAERKNRPLVLAVETPAVEQVAESGREGECADKFDKWDINEANLSIRNENWHENFKMQVQPLERNKACQPEDMKLIGCFWSMQECMLAAWLKGRRFFIFGKSSTTQGECLVFKYGDQCPNKTKDNPKYDVLRVVNKSVTGSEDYTHMGLLAAGVHPFALPEIIAGGNIKKCPGKDGKEVPETWVVEAVMGFRDWWNSTALYRSSCTNNCVLGFGGTDDEEQIKLLADKLEARPTEAAEVCGFNMNPFIVEETQKRFRSVVFKKFFQPVLSSQKCKALDGPEGITVVGHGLGGAVAELVAACMNNGYKWTDNGFVKSDSPNFVVKSVYTMGAPRIGNGEIYNGEKGKSFPGKRIYNQGDGLVEAVRSGASHPIMDALGLKETGEGYNRAHSKTLYGGGHRTSERQQETPNFSLNLAAKYLFRMASMR